MVYLKGMEWADNLSVYYASNDDIFSKEGVGTCLSVNDTTGEIRLTGPYIFKAEVIGGAAWGDQIKLQGTPSEAARYSPWVDVCIRVTQEEYLLAMGVL